MGGGVRDRPPNQWEASYWIIIYYLQSQWRLPDQIPTSCCLCAECVAGHHGAQGGHCLDAFQIVPFALWYGI